MFIFEEQGLKASSIVLTQRSCSMNSVHASNFNFIISMSAVWHNHLQEEGWQLETMRISCPKKVSLNVKISVIIHRPTTSDVTGRDTCERLWAHCGCALRHDQLGVARDLHGRKDVVGTHGWRFNSPTIAYKIIGKWWGWKSNSNTYSIVCSTVNR